MPQITHIFKTYFPDTQGGLEEAIRQIAKATVKSGFDVKVISVSKKPSINVLNGIMCQSYKESFSISSNPFSCDLFHHFKDIIYNADIIHLHFPWPTSELLTLLYNVKKPIVLNFHCDILSSVLIKKMYIPFIRMLLNRVSVIVAASSNLMRNTNVLQDYIHKCSIINYWLDTERFEKQGKPNDNLKEFVTNLGKFGLFVGVLRWYKGLDILLDASKKIKNSILIVGKGPLYSELEARVKREKITNVFLMGYLNDEDLKYLLEKTTFVVLPSISPAEAFGQILLESLYFKKPMISTSLGTGTDYVNIHNKTGFVVNPNNILELRFAMNTLFNDEKLTKSFGINAFKRYQELFTEDTQAFKYVGIYNSLLS